MNLRNAVAFVKYGIDEKKSRIDFIGSSVGISFFSMILGFVGFFRTPVSFILSLLIYFISILFVIFIAIKTKFLDFEKIIACYLSSSLFAMSLFSLCCLELLYINNISLAFLISIIPLFLSFISLGISFVKFKKNKYINKKNNLKYKNLSRYVLIGILFGIPFLKIGTFNFEVNKEVLAAAALLLLSSIFAILGAPLVLKLYYAKELKKRKIKLDE